MKELYDWMEDAETFAAGSNKISSWPTLIAGGEWVGKRMEEEIDRARRDQKEDLERNGSDRTER